MPLSQMFRDKQNSKQVLLYDMFYAEGKSDVESWGRVEGEEVEVAGVRFRVDCGERKIVPEAPVMKEKGVIGCGGGNDGK